MTPCTSQRTRWRAAAAALAAVVVVGFWAGCSPEKHYKTLSFFFDGVPNPDDPKGQVILQRRQGGQIVSLVSYVHDPYTKNNCEACHATRTEFFQDAVPPKPDACLKCHQDAPHKYPRMHGPVAVMECLWCHDPHRSTQKALLRRPAQKLCRECHDSALLSPQPPEHLDAQSDCLACHGGHGGTERYFLKVAATGQGSKPGAASPQASPSTQPSADGGAQ